MLLHGIGKTFFQVLIVFPCTNSLLSLFLCRECCLCYLKMGSHDGGDEELPPPPPVPPDVVPIKAEDVVGELPANKPVKPKRLLMDRPGIGRKGQLAQLYSNHFKVAVKSTEDFFFHYYVCLLTEFTIFCSKYIIVCPLSDNNLSLADEIALFYLNR